MEQAKNEFNIPEDIREAASKQPLLALISPSEAYIAGRIEERKDNAENAMAFAEYIATTGYQYDVVKEQFALPSSIPVVHSSRVLTTKELYENYELHIERLKKQATRKR